MGFAAAAFIFLCTLVQAPPSNAAVRTAAAEFKNMILDKPYAAMEGPNRLEFVPVEPVHDTYIWIVGMSVKVLDHGQESPRYLCHSRIGTAPRNLDLSELEIVRPSDEDGMQGLIAVSQGLSEVKFPPGFGLRVFAPTARRGLLFGAQVQADKSAPVPVDLTVRMNLSYVGGKEARAANMKALTPFRFTMPGREHHVRGSHAHGHFVVPPGRHKFTTLITREHLDKLPERATFHYMRMHLHAYATYMELFDLTAGKTVWSGKAETDLKTGALISTEYYSSEKGIPLAPDHQYRLTAEYNNTTSQDVEGMAFIQAYYD
jgi:hypothetical protein